MSIKWSNIGLNHHFSGGFHLLPPRSDVLINEIVVDTNKVKVKMFEEGKSGLNDSLWQLKTRNSMKELELKLEKQRLLSQR